MLWKYALSAAIGGVVASSILLHYELKQRNMSFKMWAFGYD